MRLAFTVYGEAKTAGSKRTVPVRRKDGAGNWYPTGKTLVIDDNPRSKAWKDQVAQAAGRAMDGKPLIDGAVRVDVTFYRPRPKSQLGTRGNVLPSAPDYPITKPDRGKLLRAVEDALTGVIYRDDAQACDGDVRKRFGEPARAEIVVEKLPPLRERAAPLEQLVVASDVPTR